MTETKEKASTVWLITGLSLTGLFIWWLRPKPYALFPYYNFFQPDQVAQLAASFPQEDEDAFILSSWNWVATEIAYEPIGSDITFIDSQVSCLRCHLPSEVLLRGKGNCIGKSALLASILLNRLPQDRVYVAVGDARINGFGGHSWVELVRNGDLYLLETTQPPPANNPWIKVSSLSTIYVPYALFSSEYFSCSDGKLCVSIDKA